MGCYSRHCDFDKKDDFRRVEVLLEDILLQLQAQAQSQNQDQDQYQGQAQSQSDRTKFENNGNPHVYINNEANALSIAAIVIVLVFLNDFSDGPGNNGAKMEEVVKMFKELYNSSK